MEPFIDRYEAGKILAQQLQEYTNQSDVIVLALPRGGVPVGYEVAKFLSVPLDIFVVRKLGVPYHEELAMGAIASGDSIFLNKDIINQLHISKEAIDHVIQSEKEELQRREIKYRGERPFPKLDNKTIILVDDGIATGASMRVAVQALRQYKPKSIVVAVPVASRSTYDEMRKIADNVICPLTPLLFSAVGEWYQDFSQTSDEEVYLLLHEQSC